MPKKKQGKPTYDQRADNYYGHQSMNLKSREAILKSGAKKPKKPEDLPMAKYRHDKMAETLERGDKLRKEKPRLFGNK